MIKVEVHNLELPESKLKAVKEKIKNNIDKNIGDILDMYNITFTLKNMTMLQFTMLSSLRNISSKVLKRDYYTFSNIRFDNVEIESMYSSLIEKCRRIKDILETEYNMKEIDIEYIEPMSKLVDVIYSMSAKEFLMFVNLCYKYEELNEINVVLYDNDLLFKVMSLSSLVSDEVDLFTKFKIDEKVRSILSDNKRAIYTLSDIQKIAISRNTDRFYNKMSVIGFGSYVGFRDMVTSNKFFNIKLENIVELNKNSEIGLYFTFPESYSKLDEDDINFIDKYIYDWVCFINKVYLEEPRNIDKTLLCNLGCFCMPFIMNNDVQDYKDMHCKVKTEESFELLNRIINNLFDVLWEV